MASSEPIALKYLAVERNTASDTALVHSLPELSEDLQRSVFELLLRRGHLPSLAAVVGRFSHLRLSVRNQLCDRVRDLFDGVSQAISSSTLNDRLGAIDLIQTGNCFNLAYLLPQALRLACPHTREHAAGALHQLTARFLEEKCRGEPSGTISPSASHGELLAAALQEAVAGWESHFQSKALEAALWMDDRLVSVIVAKLREPRARLASMVSGLLQVFTDRRMAGFMLRALAIPELRASASQGIARTHHRPKAEAIVEESWLLVDPEIERGFRRLPDCLWIQESPLDFHSNDPGFMDKLVHVISFHAKSPDQFVERARALLRMGEPRITEAVVWKLIEEPSEGASTELLRSVAERKTDSMAVIAARELWRRQWRSLDEADQGASSRESAALSAGRPGPVLPTDSRFEQYWKLFDGPHAPALAALETELLRDPAHLANCLRSKLADDQAADRLRALRIIRKLGVARRVEEQIYQSAHDSERNVRSHAVSLLRELPGVTTERILRNAVNDPDDRVQSNAIETMTSLGLQDRTTHVVSKLNAPHHRTRATAIASLLRLEVRQAATSLVEMLDHASPAHRLSALWVVEHLQLRSMLKRIAALSGQDQDPRVRTRAARLLRQLESSPPQNHSTSSRPPTGLPLPAAKGNRP
ncbi:MAG: HEAT repeat domain-containing protein [Planctomycetota bacterium]